MARVRPPAANEPFTVTGWGGLPAEIRGNSDNDGVVRILVKNDPATMTLKIVGIEITVHGGGLQAIDQGDHAIKQRLVNLAFGESELLAEKEAFSGALAWFQKVHSLSETGEADDTTRSKIKEFHGS
jgi:hypothetical protein